MLFTFLFSLNITVLVKQNIFFLHQIHQVIAVVFIPLLYLYDSSEQLQTSVYLF